MNNIGNCRTISIGGAAIGGLLLWILLALGERGWFSSLLIAALIAVAAALLLLALVCRDEVEDMTAASPAPLDQKTAAPETAAAPAATAAPKETPAPATSPAEDTGGRAASSAAPGQGGKPVVNDTAVLDDSDADADSREGDLGEEVARTQSLDREAEAAAEPDMPDGVAAGLREKPELLDAPQGQPDDLKQLRGVGPRLEEQLNRLGVWHLRQIASWGEGEAAWIDDHLEGFKGRIQRDDWIGQARELTKDEA
ncbi:hypothetical protein [Limimaricola sp. AA108-03]|uniref:hypothetical protein n=1 Tax=Limimaricola sp. AA108-03 TaxID=3425945 RepID=UPI003D76ABCA